MTIHGDGHYTRTFIHVDDVANGLDAVLEHGKIGEVYNIGSEDEISVL